MARTLSAVDPAALADRHITGTNIAASPVREIVEPLVEAAAAGRLVVPVTQTTSVEDAGVRLAGFSQRGKRGRHVIAMTT